jgi:hypothetical protein
MTRRVVRARRSLGTESGALVAMGAEGAHRLVERRCLRARERNSRHRQIAHEPHVVTTGDTAPGDGKGDVRIVEGVDRDGPGSPSAVELETACGLDGDAGRKAAAARLADAEEAGLQGADGAFGADWDCCRGRRR